MKQEVVEKLAALLTVAFGLIAALAWNDAIKAIFAQVFGRPDALAPMITYAVVVTIIAVWATIKIGQVSEKTIKK